MKTLADLAVHRENGVCRIADIARRQGIPAKFLEQILLVLKGGGIVASKRGIKGGYYLDASPSEVTVADVVRLTGGQLSPPGATAPRTDETEAALQGLWQELAEHIAKELNATTLQDVCEKIERLSDGKGADYVI